MMFAILSLSILIFLEQGKKMKKKNPTAKSTDEKLRNSMKL